MKMFALWLTSRVVAAVTMGSLAWLAGVRTTFTIAGVSGEYLVGGLVLGGMIEIFSWQLRLMPYDQ